MLEEFKAQGIEMNEGANKLTAWLEKLEANADSTIVKPGDASMAAPFTAREPSSTLVTTLQMFKILGLMSLTTAYSLSILYLEGIKLGDFQATATGLLSAALFFMLSASKPMRTLSSARPHSKVFCKYIFLSIVGQFCVHVGFLITVYNISAAETPKEQRLKPDSDFSPNIVNSACFLCSFALQTTTFAVNYIGHPFNISIFEHKMLLYTLLASSGIFFVLAAEASPPLNESVELVSLPQWLRVKLVAGAVADFLLSFSIERTARALFPAATPLSKEEEARKLVPSRGKHD
uniref:Cation-transporting atpase n=1 Tax=Tetraselmis sp. GSL018 TaxID=582737 RepID=A0A061QM05_9CHLO